LKICWKIDDFLKTHPSEIVFLKIAYSKENSGFLFRNVKPRVTSLLKKYEKNLCLNTYTKLKDFQDNNKRLCLYEGNFLNKKYVFPEKKLFGKTNAPKVFEKEPLKQEKCLTRIGLNTMSWRGAPIHPYDLNVYSEKKAKDWFERNLEDMNIVSMDFYGEKLSYVEQMMEENKKYQKVEQS